MRTAAEVRSHFLSNWRGILPEILVTGVRVGTTDDEPPLIDMDLPGIPGAVRRLLLVPSSTGEPRQIRGLLPRVRSLATRPGMWAGLLVPHMGAAGVRLCREAGVGFVDCCGNAYLRFNQVMVEISGNRNRFTERKQVRTLFNDKATIPLRVMLARPGDWLTTREIAEEGNLSLGWVSQVLQQMNADGYVERKRGGGSRLVRPCRLLQDWLDEYAFDVNEVFPFRLRDGDPEQALQRLRTVKSGLADRYALTLEAAMHALHLGSQQRRLPFDLHIYLHDLGETTEETIETWREVLGLRPAGHGADCFLVKPTYPHGIRFGTQASHGLRTVSDLQLYMDMYHWPEDGRSRAQRQIAPRLPFELDLGA